MLQLNCPGMLKCNSTTLMIWFSCEAESSLIRARNLGGESAIVEPVING